MLAAIFHSKSLATSLRPSIYYSSYQGFYTFLQQNSELPDSVYADSVDIKLVDDLTPSHLTNKPNIFIFVIDSLRRDYVSTYNKSVTFTPGLDAFARESIVMENAFTRYGGTVLSEPAIWTGSLQLHKQYIIPFAPMNSLQKLMDMEGYEKWISIDPVVKIILREDPSITELELDKHTRWVNLNLEKTAKELESRLDHRAADSKPVFVYTQSQDLHPVKLNQMRNGAMKVTYKKAYPGFDPFYASELERIDQGFAEFIHYLKSHNLYENSIVVVTSDTVIHWENLADGDTFRICFQRSSAFLNDPSSFEHAEEFVFGPQNSLILDGCNSKPLLLAGAQTDRER